MNAWRRVTVFMEDSSATGAHKSFGPALLLRACVADRKHLSSLYELKTHIDVVPLGPNANVLKRMAACATNGAPWPAVFTLDRDRVAELLAAQKLNNSGCLSGQREALREHASARDAVLVLIRDNLEDVLRAIRLASDGHAALTNLAWESAIADKALFDRDKVLNAVASYHDRAVRDKACELNPSLDYLVAKTASMLFPAEG